MKSRRLTERIAIGILMIISLITLIKLQVFHPALLVFSWLILSFYFINLWLYEEEEKGLYFVLPLILMNILSVQVALSFISYLFGIEIFLGIWAKLFAWPSFIAVMATAFYILFMLDKNMRSDIKNIFLFKKKKGVPCEK